jgi:ubiquinone/menaquinone biosynthesis C-methylase UbiE
VQDPDRRSARAFFDASADGYDDQHYGPGARSLMSVRLARMLTAVDGLALSPGARVLDAGCGPGHLALALAGRGLRVHAVDTSHAMLDRARARCEGAAAAPALQLASVERLPYADASFELVCSAGVIEYLGSDAAFLAEVRRVLRPGAHALLPVTNFWSPAGYLDFAIEAAKRVPWLARAVNASRLRHPLRPRHFRVRRHRPAQFRQSLSLAGLEPVEDAYFYLLPWPHPFDRLFPRATARANQRLEGHVRGRIRWLAEGYLVLARRAG